MTLAFAKPLPSAPMPKSGNRKSRSAGTHASADAKNVQPRVRDIILNEVQSQISDHTLWHFREIQEQNGARKLLDVIQTKIGDIHRLLAVNGQPLNGNQLAAEDARIQKLLNHPNQIQAAQKKRDADANEQRTLLKSFPDAFLFRYEGQQGSILEVGFVPNPSFHPDSHAAEVFHHMEGTMQLDMKASRLVKIDGHLTSEVKFGGGLFGHLDKGGTFRVVQRYIGDGHWDETLMDVHMDGRVLFFKTVAVRQRELYSDYHEVPENISLQQAAQELRKDTSTTASLTGK